MVRKKKNIKRTKHKSYRNLKSIRRIRRTKRTRRTKKTRRTKRSSYKNLRKRKRTKKNVNKKGGANREEILREALQASLKLQTALKSLNTPVETVASSGEVTSGREEEIPGKRSGLLDKVVPFVEARTNLEDLKLALSKNDSEPNLGFELLPGLKLFGLQYCLKEKYRIAGKVDKKLLELETVQEKYNFLNSASKDHPVKDVLRFTVIFSDPSRYLEKLQTLNKHFLHRNIDNPEQDQEILRLHSQHQEQDGRVETHDPRGLAREAMEQPVSPPQIEYSYDRAEKVFALLDQDSNGHISYNELISFLKNNGITVDEEKIKQIFDGSDTNQDGKLSLDEVKKLLNSPIIDDDIKTQLLLFGEVECLRDKYIDGLFARAKLGLNKMINVVFNGLDQNEYLRELFRPKRPNGGGKIKSVDRWHTDEPYKGINVVYLLNLDDSENVPVEIQYHTEESIKMKQKLHDLYEETQNLEYKITQNKKQMLNEFRTLDPPFVKIDSNKLLLYGEE
jgi:hypothetical protein